MVCMYVRLSVGHVREPTQIRLNRSRCRLGGWLGCAQASQATRIRWDLEPPREGPIWEVDWQMIKKAVNNRPLRHPIKSFAASCGRVDIAQAGCDRSLVDDHCRRATVYAPLRENMTLSTKLEIHNVWRCRHSTELRLQITCKKNLVKFRNIWDTRADKQTDRQDIQTRPLQYFAQLPGAK